MPKRKATPITNPFKPCSQCAALGGYVRVIRDDRTALRRCSCWIAWKASQASMPVDGKAKAANA